MKEEEDPRENSTRRIVAMDFEIGGERGGNKRERGRERSRRCDYIRWGNGMDAKYRQGCQVAETAAAPLSVLGRVSSARREWERGAEGRQGRVIDRGWKGWRYDAPGDVIARYNPLELPAGALSFTTPSLVCCLALCAIHLIPSPLSNQRGLSYPSLLLLLLLATIFSL